MKKKSTNIVCVLDRSGSMFSIADEVINEFNEFIRKQKEIPGKATLTLVIFDSEYNVVHNRTPLDTVPPLTCEVYFPRGMTALNDALGTAINSIPEKERTIVYVATDGAENASNEYTTNQVRELVESRRKAGWQFMFVGAGIDAFGEGSKMGFTSKDTFMVEKSARGVETAYATLSDVTTAYRAGA